MLLLNTPSNGNFASECITSVLPNGSQTTCTCDELEPICILTISASTRRSPWHRVCLSTLRITQDCSRYTWSTLVLSRGHTSLLYMAAVYDYSCKFISHDFSITFSGKRGLYISNNRNSTQPVKQILHPLDVVSSGTTYLVSNVIEKAALSIAKRIVHIDSLVHVQAYALF